MWTLFFLVPLGFGGGGNLSSPGGREETVAEVNLPSVLLCEAPLVKFPGPTDSNSPAHSDGDTFYIFNSAGHPTRSSGSSLFNLGQPSPVKFDNEVNGGRWFEATYKDDDDTLYGWYHNEPGGVCPERQPEKYLTAPRIGAAKSKDNGLTWQDLGFVLEAPPNTLHCDTENYYFAGGNGDFSVILDTNKEYFYFFISTYGDFAEQGVSLARLRYADRDDPLGKVWKWYDGKWEEPGIGGRVTPIFQAAIDWHQKNADAFWGPSIHWNTHLNTYVILLNHAIDANWSQEGIYVSFNRNLANPNGWSKPKKIRHGGAWYPQVIGTNTAKRETDKLAGRIARYFEAGESRWQIIFLRPGEKSE